MSATPISERLSRLGGRPSASCAAALLAILASGLLAGCANRDSVVVGAIPDDYRTNHPIIIGEKQRTLDLAVGASDRGATRIQKQAVQGFLADYDKTAAPVLSIVAPSG